MTGVLARKSQKTEIFSGSSRSLLGGHRFCTVLAAKLTFSQNRCWKKHVFFEFFSKKTRFSGGKTLEIAKNTKKRHFETPPIGFKKRFETPFFRVFLAQANCEKLAFDILSKGDFFLDVGVGFTSS